MGCEASFNAKIDMERARITRLRAEIERFSTGINKLRQEELNKDEELREFQDKLHTKLLDNKTVLAAAYRVDQKAHESEAAGDTLAINQRVLQEEMEMVKKDATALKLEAQEKTMAITELEVEYNEFVAENKHLKA